MKSYIIKIELKDTNPQVWRRVIVPAGATLTGFGFWDKMEQKFNHIRWMKA